jgi:hypothetical protein
MPVAKPGLPTRKAAGTGLELEAHARDSCPSHLGFSSPGEARMKLKVDSPRDRLLLDFPAAARIRAAPHG